MAHSFDPYEELQLSPDAEPEMIKAAFRTLAKKYHPDKCSDPTQRNQAEERMKRLNLAQELILSGEYVPPRKEPAATSKPDFSDLQTPNEKPANPTRNPIKKNSNSIPWPVFLLAAFLLCGLLVVQKHLSENQMTSAQRLYQEENFQEALAKVNRVISFRNESSLKGAYQLRAKIWVKLGHPDRAETDLANARGLQGGLSVPPKQPSATPTGAPFPIHEPTPDHVP